MKSIYVISTKKNCPVCKGAGFYLPEGAAGIVRVCSLCAKVSKPVVWTAGLGRALNGVLPLSVACKIPAVTYAGLMSLFGLAENIVHADLTCGGNHDITQR